MKLTKIFAALAAIASFAAIDANAQLGFDTYSALRTYFIASQNITVNGGVGLITNAPIDHVKLIGTAKIDVLCVTNTGTTGGTLTVQPWVSYDSTNWVAMTGFAVTSGTTTETITNTSYNGSTNLVVNNSVILPGTIVYPTAATAGYATPYFSENLFTNTGAVTLKSGVPVQIGVRISDQPRYLELVWTAGGTVTNWSVGAELTSQSIH